jgi:hypothetical protein
MVEEEKREDLNLMLSHIDRFDSFNAVVATTNPSSYL